MKGTVLITGAKGFIGTELSRQLKALDYKVIGMDMIDSPDEEKAGEYIKFNISDEGLEKVLPENLTAIVHLAGLSRDPDCRDKLQDTFKINVLSTIKLLDAAKAKGTKQFIFASSEWVYGETKGHELKDEESAIEILKLETEYAISKAVCEGAIKQKYRRGFCDVTICRFGIVYGPRPNKMTAVEGIFENIRTKDTVEVGALKSGRCFVHVEDLARGIIASIGVKGYETINLVGPKVNTIEAIVEASKKITGKNPKVVETNPDGFNVRNVSNKKAIELIKWQPKYSLEEGMRTLLPK